MNQIDNINIIRLSEKEFEDFSKFIYKLSGILLKPSKITLLSNRLRKRLKALNIKTFREYYKYVTDPANSSEITNLLDAVSTNETYFFRNDKHFEALEKVILPDIIEKRAKIKRINIWSAGCSTGEEPYTIGIIIKEILPDFKLWQINIKATDIAPSVIQFAKNAIYTERRINRVPPLLLKKYFLMLDKDKYQFIDNDIKSFVNFNLLNLNTEDFRGKYDIIFCRNVMIYFNKEVQKTLVHKFYNVIEKDGYLFIGHSETLHSVSTEFKYKKILNAPVYIPVSGGIN